MGYCGYRAVLSDLDYQREHAHELLDRLPPDKLDAVHTLLEVMVDEKNSDDDELTGEDRAAIQAGLDSLDRKTGIPMEEVLADFGLTMADFENMADSSAADRPRP